MGLDGWESDFPAVSSGELLVCPAFPVCSGRALWAGGQGFCSGGGSPPIVLRHRASQGFDQGQWVGRCSTGRRCGRVSRAGTFTMRRRSVEPRATAWVPPARTPAARRRLWAIAAHRIQAELAPNRPDGMCARGPSMRSANTVSMIACWRWIGRPGPDPRVGDVNPLVQQRDQAGLLAQRHHRHQSGTRHEMAIIEHCRIGLEPMGHFHRKCLSCAGQIVV